MNKPIFRWVLGTLVVAILFSCAQRKPPAPDWAFAKEAIHLRVMADSQLNLHEGKSHTLMVCIYQLRSMTTFPTLTDEMSGRYKLLECEPYDSTVVAVKRLILHPGDNYTLLLDRASGARYLGLVAGYYLLEKRRIIRTVDFPNIFREKGWTGQSANASREKLKLDITFGAQQIERLEIR